MKILICDDDPVVHESLNIYLKNEGYDRLSAFDGIEALHMIKTEQPDLVVLDVMMPKMNGFDLCKEIRKISTIPILMLTAKGEEIDRILGLEIGADDYITKPFSVRELVARVKALLRLVEKHSGDSKSDLENSIVIDNLLIDVEKFLVEKDGLKIDLTAKEFAMLSLLAVNRDIIYSREDLLNELADEDSSSVPRSIDVHMTNLRKKIGKGSNGQDFIKTVRGKGYRINL